MTRDKLIIAGREVTRNHEGLYSLTDIHKAAMAAGHASASQRPWAFAKCQSDLIDAMSGRENSWAPVITAKGGRYGGGTWATELVAMQYASWLDHDIGAEFAAKTGASYGFVHRRAFERDEMHFGRSIVHNMFSAYEILPQFSVLGGKYRIDWYIPELKLAIEFDEPYHLKQKEADAIRQREIEDALGCRFARYSVAAAEGLSSSQ